MKKQPLTAVIALFVAALASPADAVHLDPNGRGQVLIYPYYTVNKQQQTLLSVTNTSSVAIAANVSIREGYNGRRVLDFDVFLSPYDSWTGTMFSLRDAGIDSDGAAILTRDSSCTAPRFSEDGTSIGGVPYVALRDFEYLVPDDGGPYTIDRTREGWIEIVAKADMAVPWSGYIAHGSDGSPPTGCAQVRTIIGMQPGMSAPSSGLMGSVGIMDVGRGTYLSTRAEALAGFTSVGLFLNTAGMPNLLGLVNDGTSVVLANLATARIIDGNGRRQDLTQYCSFR